MSRLLLTTFLVLGAMPVAAQDGGSGLSFGGNVKLEYLNDDSSLWAFDGDVGLSWRSGGLLGFDASVETTYIHDNGDSEDYTNLWAAAVLSTGAGDFAIGAPRPVLDTLQVMPRFSSSRVLDLETSFLRGPLTSVASMQDNGVTPGITWQQETGSLTFGAGYHRLNDEGIDLAEGIMRYQSGGMSLFVSAEYASVPGDNLSILQIGGLYDADRYELGASLSRLKSSETVNSLRLHGSFDVMSSLTLRADAMLVRHEDDIYSLSATYTMPNGLFVEGGGTKIGGSTEVYDLGVGLSF